MGLIRREHGHFRENSPIILPLRAIDPSKTDPLARFGRLTATLIDRDKVRPNITQLLCAS
jgi:hypothetical protein